MKKIKISNNLLLKFCFKSVTISAISLASLSAIFSYIIFKFDLDVETINTISIIVIAIASMIDSLISSIGFKNNGIFIGALSTLPIILYSFATYCFGENTLILFLIKAAISICIGSLVGCFITRKSNRIKI